MISFPLTRPVSPLAPVAPLGRAAPHAPVAPLCRVAPLFLMLFVAGCGEESPPPPPEDVPPVASAPGDAETAGMALVASGWEPPWRMEIAHGGELTLTPVFGMERIVASAPPPQRDEEVGITDYVADFDDFAIRVQVRDEECQDPRGVRLYEATVFVQLDGRELVGCGTWGVDEPSEGG